MSESSQQRTVYVVECAWDRLFGITWEIDSVWDTEEQAAARKGEQDLNFHGNVRVYLATVTRPDIVPRVVIPPA